MAKKQYFGEETVKKAKKTETTQLTRHKRKYTRRTPVVKTTRRGRKAKANNTDFIMVPVPANMAFQFGVTIGRMLNNQHLQ